MIPLNYNNIQSIYTVINFPRGFGVTLKDEFTKSMKLDRTLRRALAKLDQNTFRDVPLFNAFVFAAGAARIPDVPGVTFTRAEGPLRPARDITLDGLKALVEDDGVAEIRSSVALRVPRSWG